MIGIDQDEYALATSRKRLENIGARGNYILVKNNFKNLADICMDLEITKVNGV